MKGCIIIPSFILECLTLTKNSPLFFGASEVVVTKRNTIITKTRVVFVSNTCFQSNCETTREKRREKITLI